MTENKQASSNKAVQAPSCPNSELMIYKKEIPSDTASFFPIFVFICTRKVSMLDQKHLSFIIY